MAPDTLVTLKVRLRIAGLLVLIMGAILIYELARWTLFVHASPAQGESMWRPRGNAVAYVTRGNILDRNGSILVATGYYWEVGVSPNVVANTEAEIISRRLAPYVNTPVERLIEMLSGTEQYILVDRVDYHTGLEINRLALKGVRVDPIPIRVYPEGSLAAHVLGFVNREQKAYYGVEKGRDDYLRGAMKIDFSEHGVPVSRLGPRFEWNSSPDSACDLVLTIDRAMQYYVEQILREAVISHGASEGTVVVLDPRTGELLASATYPTYEPSHYVDYPPETWDDPAVTGAYEPGSIFKILTMAAALNAGVIRPTDTYYDAGYFQVGEEKVWNLNKTAYGTVTMQDVLVYSLNVGTSYISAKLGAEHFYAYLRRFGIGECTGIELGGESCGTIRWPDDPKWHAIDLATNSFGQGLEVTPIQMAAVVGAVANRGFLMQPHVIRAMIKDGWAIELSPRVVRQVISAETAQILSEMLVEAVNRGAPVARVPGYSVAGKSGTAEIPDEKGYASAGTIAGFVGYLPASDPAFVIVVKIVRPKGETLGAKVAGPVFQKVAKQLVTLRGVPPDQPRAD